MPGGWLLPCASLPYSVHPHGTRRNSLTPLLHPVVPDVCSVNLRTKVLPSCLGEMSQWLCGHEKLIFTRTSNLHPAQALRVSGSAKGHRNSSTARGILESGTFTALGAQTRTL